MTDLRKTAKQALQYLESNADADSDWEIMIALRKALEQPEQEPVAFAAEILEDVNGVLSTRWADWWIPNEGDKLYTTPPAAQPEQEPCVGKDPRCPCQDGDACHYKDCGDTKARPVAQPEQVDCPRCGHVCSQRPWQGLTDEEVKHEWEVWRASLPRYTGFAQGIETKLKERNT